VSLENAVMALARTIALDRAYQAASPNTCQGCGLPAVRFFGDRTSYRPPFFACGVCRPPREHTEHSVDHVVADLDELSRLDLTERVTAQGSRQRFPLALVRSLGRAFSLEPSGSTFDGVTTHVSCVDGYLWYSCYEVANTEPVDLPHRRAVERLLRIASEETGGRGLEAGGSP
jgi:hypothetical protein